MLCCYQVKLSVQHACKMRADSCAAECSALTGCFRSGAWLLFTAAVHADKGSSS